MTVKIDKLGYYRKRNGTIDEVIEIIRCRKTNAIVGIITTTHTGKESTHPYWYGSQYFGYNDERHFVEYLGPSNHHEKEKR